MEWWLIIGAVVIMALVFAYREHNRERRRLGKLFKLLAAKHRDQAKAGSFLYLPELFFEKDHGSYRLGAMATSGSPGDGPFTYLKLRMAEDCALKATLKRKDAKADAAVALEEAYGIKGAGWEELTHLLKPRLARKLLESRLKGLELRLNRADIALHLEGFVQDKEALDEMIELAGLLAEACQEEAPA